jgi:hypothetical protein
MLVFDADDEEPRQFEEVSCQCDEAMRRGEIDSPGKTNFESTTKVPENTVFVAEHTPKIWKQYHHRNACNCSLMLISAYVLKAKKKPPPSPSITGLEGQSQHLNRAPIQKASSVFLASQILSLSP